MNTVETHRRKIFVPRPGETLCNFTPSERCEICLLDRCENSKKMAEGGLYDPQFMIVSENGVARNVPFSDSLKNSSTLSDWIDHEKRVVVSTARNMEIDSQNLK